jgi:predicted secreted protein
MVALDGQPPIAGIKSDDIEVTCGLQEVASPSQGNWSEYLAGRKDWQVTTNYLLLSTSGISKLLNVGTTYLLSFYDMSNSNQLRGNAIMVTAKISAIKGNLVTGSFQFKGTGALQFSQS